METFRPALEQAIESVPSTLSPTSSRSSREEQCFDRLAAKHKMQIIKATHWSSFSDEQIQKVSKMAYLISSAHNERGCGNQGRTGLEQNYNSCCMPLTTMHVTEEMIGYILYCLFVNAFCLSSATTNCTHDDAACTLVYFIFGMNIRGATCRLQ